MLTFRRVSLDTNASGDETAALWKFQQQFVADGMRQYGGKLSSTRGIYRALAARVYRIFDSASPTFLV